MAVKDNNREQETKPPVRVYRECPKCKKKWVVEQSECDCGEALYRINSVCATTDGSVRIAERYSIDTRPGINGHNCFRCPNPKKDLCFRCGKFGHTSAKWTCYRQECTTEQKTCCRLIGGWLERNPANLKDAIRRFAAGLERRRNPDIAERAAILEFDAGMERADAEEAAGRMAG
jgi:hypothetical protein